MWHGLQAGFSGFLSEGFGACETAEHSAHPRALFASPEKSAATRPPSRRPCGMGFLRYSADRAAG